MSASLLPPGMQQFTDANGIPLAMGTVQFYIPGTTTPKDTWQDSGQVALNTNPVQLDGAGRAVIWGTGSYREIVKDAANNTIWDRVTGVPDPTASIPATQVTTAAGPTVQSALDTLTTNIASTQADVVVAETDIDTIVNRLAAMISAKDDQRLKTLEEAVIAYLPSLTTSGATYYAVYGTKRLVSGSTMALARGIRNSNSAATDLAANADAITLFSIKDIRGAGTNAKFDKWYDQTANARDLTQTTAANRPVMHEDGTINTFPAMTFPGVEGGVARTSYFITPTISLDRQNFTMFFVIDPTASLKNQIYLRLEKAAGLVGINLFHEAVVDNGRAAVNIDGAVQNTHKYIQASPHIITINGSAGAVDIWFDDIHVTLTNAAATIVLGYLGGSPPDSLATNCRYGAWVVCDKSLNAADVAAVQAVLRRRYSLSTNYDATLVYSGTSRTVSGQADNAFTKIFYEQKQFRRNYRIFNLGQDGQALSTTLTNFAAREATAYDSTKPMIYIVDDAINDLGGLGASSVPATIYTTITGIVNAAKALGSNVYTMVRTTLPQDSSNGTYGIASATINTNRVTLNGLILANAAAASATTDTAGVTTMGVYPTNPDDSTKYGDKLHATALGNSLVASADAATVEGLPLP